jgi:AcrR family transcriptional regulator
MTKISTPEPILFAAMAVAQRVGWNAMTRDQIAEQARVSAGLVTLRLGTMVNLRRAVMRAAIHRENLTVVAQGLAVRDKQALKAPAALIKRCQAALGK